MENQQLQVYFHFDYQNLKRNFSIFDHLTLKLLKVNLAIALSQLKKTVALLDADIYGPSLPILMNLRAQRPDVNRKRLLIPLMSYGIKCMSMGFLVPEDSAAIWRGPMVVIQQILNIFSLFFFYLNFFSFNC